MLGNAPTSPLPGASEAEDLYEQMGLATAAGRARFRSFQSEQKSPVAMTIVVSSTSQPFA